MLKKQLTVKFQKDKRKHVVNIMPPDYKSESAMRIEYAKAYRSAIQQGVATRPSMLELMREEGIWTEKQEDELTSLTIQAALIEGVLREQTEFEEQKKVVLELTNVRNKIYELVNLKTLPLEHTAEQIAEGVKLDYYLATCTYDDNGVRYFKSHKDFLERRHDTDVQKINDSVIEELSKDNVELLRQLPEHKWLINNKFMDKKGNILDKAFEGELDSQAEEVEEVAKKE